MCLKVGNECAFILSSQVWLTVWLTVFFWSVISAEVKIVSEPRDLSPTCRAIETVGDTLQIETMQNFLLTYDLQFDLPTEFLQRYRNSGDDLGEVCMAEVEYRINNSMSNYRVEISKYQDEQFMLQIFLNDPEFRGRGKRVSGPVIFAILVSISNFAATGYNLFATNYKIGSMEHRLGLMANRIQLLEKNQMAIHNNFELLFEKTDFLGLQQNILLKHVDTIKTVHSCSIMELSLSTLLSDLDTQMSSVVESLSTKKLTHHMIDRNLLEQITKQDLFYKSIYGISPSMLYEHAHTELVSFKNNKITFLVSFPVISDDFRFSMFSILEAPRNVARMEQKEQNSFLAPFGMSIDEIVANASLIRSVRHCKSNAIFTACPDIAFENKCMESILRDEEVVKHCPIIPSLSHVTYSTKGALIHLRKDEQILDRKTNRFVYENKNNSKMCVYLPQRKDLVFVSTNRSYDIFPNSIVNHFHSKPRMKIYKLHLNPFVDNLTLPIFRSNRTLTPPSFVPEIDYTLIFVIVGCGTLTISLLINLIVMCIRYRVCTVNANNLF